MIFVLESECYLSKTRWIEITKKRINIIWKNLTKIVLNYYVFNIETWLTVLLVKEKKAEIIEIMID